ncbi:MAG: hypothetical protein HYZ00_05665 [Candidatus Hydrogenedentes bacterium]|nr:hypothetical protein [Candidatus Hydrogenedentota bacterium]
MMSKPVGLRTQRVVMRISIAGALAATAGALWAWSLVDEYEGRATLLFTHLPGPRVFEDMLEFEAGAESNWRVEALKGRVQEALRFPLDAPGAPEPRFQLSVPDYALLFKSDAIIRKLRDTAAQPNSMRDMALEVFRERLQVRTRLLAQMGEDLVYQEVVELVVTEDSPKMAADLANDWARACVALAAEVRQQRLAQVQSFFDERIEATRARLAAAPDEAARAAIRPSLQMLEALRALAGTDTAGVTIQSEAAPAERPVGPRRGLILLASGLFGLLLMALLEVAWAVFPAPAAAVPGTAGREP